MYNRLVIFIINFYVNLNEEIRVTKHWLLVSFNMSFLIDVFT